MRPNKIFKKKVGQNNNENGASFLLRYSLQIV